MADSVEIEKTLGAVIDKHLRALREELLKELPAAGQGGATSATLNSAICRIAGARSQTEIMQSLLDAAAPLANRAAVLVFKGERLSGWRSRGFDGAAGARLREISLAAEGEGGWKQALAASAGAEPIPKAAADAFFAAVGAPSDNRAYLLPLIVKDRPVALLYADAGDSANSLDAPGLELLARMTGMCLELLAVRGQRPVAAAAAAAAPGPAAQEAEPAPAEAPEAAGQPQALEEAAPSPAPEPPPAPPAVTEAVPLHPATARAAGPDLSAIPEADHDIHKKAFRAAKVMVDELILYNKDKIQQGQAERDIYGAVQDDIDKCRATYQKRFKNTPAGKVDYFHQHLLQRLAQDDPAILGADYPGPLV